MWLALWEVLKDLCRFVANQSWPEPAVSDRVVSAPALSERVKQLPIELSTVKKTATIAATAWLGRVAYVSVPEVSCLAAPEPSFDLQVGVMYYGDLVSVAQIKDDYAAVETVNLSGWVPVSALSDDKRCVFPKLESGVVYQAGHQATVNIRHFIRDEMSGAELELPLQSSEYVLYKLKRHGIAVSWPIERPRLPGRWQKILRGALGVMISVEPSTGAVFERVAESDAPGFLGWVEEVHPDGSIVLHSVGRVMAGEYLVDALSRDEWKEWRPVFISFR